MTFSHDRELLSYSCIICYLIQKSVLGVRKNMTVAHDRESLSYSLSFSPDDRYTAPMNKPGALVAIGGGALGWQGEPVTTTPIDRAILEAADQARPRVLFVPTAGHDSQPHVEKFELQYRDNLGADVQVLYLYECKPSQRIIEDLIAWANVVYVGGGNTLRMLNRWRALGIDRLLLKAHRQGTILAGMSAGAQGWFECGLTDCWRRDHDPSKAVAARGLGLIAGLCNPHYTKDAWLAERGKDVLNRLKTIGINIDDNAALIVEGNRYRVITSQPNAWVSRSWWEDGDYRQERLAELGSISGLTA